MRSTFEADTAVPTTALAVEIQRYLEAVALFRELGHEPTWRPERGSVVAERVLAWLDPRERSLSGR